MRDKLLNINAKIIAGLMLAVALFIVLKHEYSNDKSHQQALISVVTATARNADVPVYITALGNVTAEYSVTITSQVSGQLVKVLFKEGQKVQKGELLAEIDKKPYQAILDQYEGQLARDMALLENANLDLKRYQTLFQQNSVSKQILDTQISLVNQYDGTVKLDKGLVESAKVNLSYCDIVSPIDGQIGLRLIDEGNIIQVADNTNIALVNTLNPITVLFSIPNDELSKILVERNKTFEVLAYNQDQSKILAKGQLLAIDNKIDPSTGTIQLKAKFSNDNDSLFPNQFVNIKLLVNTLDNVLVVPISAVQYGQKGSFVYTVESGDIVKMIPVKVGASTDSNIVINSGLSSGDIIVIQGVDKLADGAHINISKHYDL